MTNDKALIIVEEAEEKKYRVLRFIEELKKKDVASDIFVSKNAVVSSDGFYLNEKKVETSKYKLVISLGNSAIHHYIISMISLNDNALVWPQVDKFNMSDKFYEMIFFSSVDIPVPQTVLLTGRRKDKLPKLAEKVGGFPCVIKKVTGSEGRYVGLVNSAEEINQFVEKMPHPSISGKKNIILQECIKESKGTDFRVICLGDEILGGIKRTSQGDDFRANVSLGGKAEIIEVDDELASLSKKIMEKSGLFYAGIDFIKSNRGYLAIEVNTCAQFEGFEKATGINVAEKIVEKLIKQV